MSICDSLYLLSASFWVPFQTVPLTAIRTALIRRLLVVIQVVSKAFDPQLDAGDEKPRGRPQTI